MPKGKEKKFKRCVKQVKSKGKARNPYAVCHKSLGKKRKRKGK